MMRKALVWMLACLMPGLVAAEIMPGSIEEVQLSNRDVNHIVCKSGDINDVVFSQEKPSTVKVNGSNAFIKFLIKDDGFAQQYVTVRSEFYIVCAGEVYTLISVPQNIPAQRIVLGTNKHKTMASNVEMYGAMSLEEQVIDLTVRAMKGELPDSVRINGPKRKGWQSALAPGAEIQEIRTVQLEGVGLTLTEYAVRTKSRAKLDERMFLSTNFGSNIVGITIHPLEVRPSQVSRAYIVQKGVSNEY